MAAGPSPTNPYDDPAPHLKLLARALEARRPGAFSVNRAGPQLLKRLESPDLELRAVLDGRAPEDPYNPALAAAYRRQVDRAELSQAAAGVAGRIAYTLPAWPAPSLDTRQQVRRQVPRKRRRRLSEGVKARQRDRYKRAMADALDAFARAHAPRRTIARRHEVQLRPRWLDHRYSCSDRPSCHGCLTITAHTAQRLRRRQAHRDYLEPVTMRATEWLADRAAALRGCREVVALRDAACGRTMLVPQSCRVRTCPDCESARQVRVVDRYSAAVAALDPELTRFLTLTIRNRPRGELVAGLVHLSESLEKLKRRAIWRGGRCRDRARCRQPADPGRPGWKLPHAPVTASMTTIEITNRTGYSWHPHAHLILEGPVIDQAELAEAWEAITADSRIVWIESVRRYADDPPPDAGFSPGDVRGALRELLKYAAKPSPAYLVERDAAPIAELLLALRGRHLTSTSGKLFGMDLDAELVYIDGLRAGPSCSMIVLVQPDNPDAEPYRAPRRCPMHGGVAEWEVAGYVARQLARRTEARAGPRPHVLSLPVTDTLRPPPSRHHPGHGTRTQDQGGEHQSPRAWA